MNCLRTQRTLSSPITMCAASMGKPIGLTRNAAAKRRRLSLTETVNANSAAMTVRSVAASPKIQAEHFRRPKHIHVSGVRTITTGKARAFSIVLMTSTSSTDASIRHLSYLCNDTGRTITEQPVLTAPHLKLNLLVCQFQFCSVTHAKLLLHAHS